MGIGDDLSEFDVAVLQAIANVTCKGQVTRTSGLPRVIETHRDCRAAEGATPEQIAESLTRLEAGCLVEVKGYKGEPHVGLTTDGYRCNRITVSD